MVGRGDKVGQWLAGCDWGQCWGKVGDMLVLLGGRKTIPEEEKLEAVDIGEDDGRGLWESVEGSGSVFVLVRKKLIGPNEVRAPASQGCGLYTRNYSLYLLLSELSAKSTRKSYRRIVKFCMGS